jgi:hypothetical protein
VSSEETDEKKTVVQRTPNSGSTVVVQQPSPPVVAPAPAPATAPAIERSDTVVSHRSTNTTAIVAMAVGVIVLLGGMAVIVSQIKFLPAPYSFIVVLGFGLILLLVGASMISSGTGKS